MGGDKLHLYAKIKQMTKIAVLGAGSWGIGVSVLLYSNQHKITLWEFNSGDMLHLKKQREHKSKLPGIVIPGDIEITDRLDKAVGDAGLLTLALPSHTVREVVKKLAGIPLNSPLIVSLSKGIENDTLNRMSEVLTQELPENLHQNIVTLSGPCHAEEVARKMPTSVVVAGFKEEASREVQKIFMNNYFRVYTSDDLIGVELGGSLKNVIAIASGICDGLKLGDNAKGALLTRGLAEITRLGVKLGAKSSTFAGLSGMGDLITTCISQYSRNRYVGEHIGRGETLKQTLEGMVMVAEGVKTTKSAYQLSQKYEVELPIAYQVYRMLFENVEPQKALMELMTRGPKNEIWS
jgi:glycerol-3-phosphate dehydrogenase (NAD(P)+)